jgi:hypothetical protein
VSFRRTTIIAAVGALSLGVAACGNDDKDSSADKPASQQQAKPVAQIDALSGRDTQVRLDSDFVAGLESLKLTPAPVGDAKIENGVAEFPITGGNVKYFKPGTIRPYVQGRVEHDGSGLRLTGGDTVVELTNFVVDPGKSLLMGKVTANGQEAAANAPLFFLDGRTLEPLQARDNGTAVLNGTTVTLTKEAAQLLNDTFKTDALKKGFPVGIARITVNTA